VVDVLLFLVHQLLALLLVLLIRTLTTLMLLDLADLAFALLVARLGLLRLVGFFMQSSLF
jgi:hypothetical protein